MDKKLRVVSDGTIRGTKVYFGNECITEYNCITRIQTDLNADDSLISATITILDVDLEVEIPVDRVTLLTEIIPKEE